MIRKEILMHFIAYNCIRRLMYEAGKSRGLAVRRISFKGTLQTLRNWDPHLNQSKISNVQRLRITDDLYRAIVGGCILNRPDRSEPRCVKRRPKNYQLLTAPRHEMKEIPHRSKYHAAAA